MRCDLGASAKNLLPSSEAFLEKLYTMTDWALLNCTFCSEHSQVFETDRPIRFPRREDVEKSNTIRMQGLSNEEIKYEAIDSGADPSRDRILANFMAPKELRLRVDAQVMLIKNVDEQLVNGTMGRVIKFIDPSNAAEGDPEVVKGAGVTGTIPKKTSTGTSVRWPMVDFSLASGGTRTMVVTPEVWKVELQTGEIQASRTQVLSQYQTQTNSLILHLVSAYSGVGDEYPQISGANLGSCQGRP